ncbi:MAG TPA: hypothetical protein VIJ02_01815 [Thermoanaerobaculia bacterium]
MEGSRLGPPVGHGDPDQDVLGIGFRVFGEDVEIAALVEDPGVEDLEFRLVLAPAVMDERAVGKLPLGVLVERLGVGGGGGGVEEEVLLLDVLAVVPLGAGEAEQPLLEDGIAAVPQGQREADAALAVADPQQAVLSPAVGAAAGVIVRQVIPGVAVRRVVLAYRPPLALGEIGPPALPVLLAPGVLLQTRGLGIGGRRLDRVQGLRLSAFSG